MDNRVRIGLSDSPIAIELAVSWAPRPALWSPPRATHRFGTHRLVVSCAAQVIVIHGGGVHMLAWMPPLAPILLVFPIGGCVEGKITQPTIAIDYGVTICVIPC